MNPELLDALDKGEASDERHKIYVLAQFFKPGKSAYVTCLPDSANDLQIFTHKFVSVKREESPPVHSKTYKTTLVQRVFNKDRSVFGDWRQD